MKTPDEKLSIPSDRNGLNKLIDRMGKEEDDLILKSERLVKLLPDLLNVSPLAVRKWIEQGYVPLPDIHPVLKHFPQLKPVDLVDPKILNELER